MVLCFVSIEGFARVIFLIYSYSYVGGYTSWLQIVILNSYMNICWSSSTNYRRSYPLAPHPSLPAFPPWLTVHLHHCSCLQDCAKNGNVTGMTSIFFVVFEVKSDIFNPDHLIQFQHSPKKTH